MSNATQEKQKTAVELFEEGDKKVICFLTNKLFRLLNKESDFFPFHDYTKHLTLQEFQDNFEWDESYSVKASWEVVVSDHTQTFECSSKEEALALVNGQKELEEPDMSDFYPEWDLAGDDHCSLVIEVENLRLKPQQPKTQYEWTLIVEPSSDAITEIQEWVEQVKGRCANYIANHTIKIIDSTLKPVEKSTTWSDVVGQK